MVKGVNRNIIEISETGHECFERAILFVREDRSDEARERLEEEAGRYLKGLTLRPRFFSRRNMWVKIGTYAAAISIGMAIASAVLSLWR